MVLGLREQDEKIERYKQYLQDLSRAGIRYTTYAHMANIKMRAYYMTGEAEARGGVLTREFDLMESRQLPLSHGRTYREDEIWKSFTHFIRQVLPTAERVGVRIGLHPDDPPVPSLGGVARIFRNYAGLERALELADSDHFGICLCLGTWAEGGKDMGKDVYEVIRALGSRGRLFKIHMRNIDRPLPRFRETFLDSGYLDMPRLMRTLHEVGFDGVVIPDHVPGEALRGEHTAYTIGYLKALRDMARGLDR